MRTFSPTGGAAHAPLRVLAVGRLTCYKGLEYLVRAMALLEHAELHLVGTGNLQRKLRDLARDLHLDRRVIFHGHLPDAQLADQFAACDCLCLPSIERTEAFGVVLLEAMARGRATIISDVPGSGMGWVVDDGVTGLHVPPVNPRALADAIANLQRDRDKIHRLGENGRQKFDRLFHIDKSAEGVAGLYRNVLAGSPDL